MAKPKPTRVDSSDCRVEMFGDPYCPHEGEWVEMVRGLATGALEHLDALSQLQTQGLTLQDEEGGNVRMAQMMKQTAVVMWDLLKDRLIAWNWTDDRGRPLPQPDGTVEPLKLLNFEELLWLFGVLQGETKVERKNGSAPSPIISGASPSQPTGAKSRTGGRGRTKD